MRGLANDPRPPGCDKLAGLEALYRIRVGHYRIVYQIRDQELVVLIVKIRHRREVYR
jgi:mRNA interferase RelE/StbE